MYFLAVGTIHRPEGLAALQTQEDEALTELRNAGIVLQAFRRAVGHGVIGILTGPDMATVSKAMTRLPFVAQGHLDFDYTELLEL